MPVQPSVILVGGLATLIGMFVLPIGQVIAWVAWAFLETESHNLTKEGNCARN